MLKENNLFRSKAAFSKPFSSHFQCIHFSPLICGAFLFNFQFSVSHCNEEWIFFFCCCFDSQSLFNNCAIHIHLFSFSDLYIIVSLIYGMLCDMLFFFPYSHFAICYMNVFFFLFILLLFAFFAFPVPLHLIMVEWCEHIGK